MLADSKVRRVRRLLGQRSSYREIAESTGVSRSTIRRIRRGRRQDRQSEHQIEKENSWDPSGPVARCPGCGHRVRMPCLICGARAAAEALWVSHKSVPLPEGDHLLELDLEEEHRLRYEQVRARRILMEQSGQEQPLPNDANPSDREDEDESEPAEASLLQ